MAQLNDLIVLGNTSLIGETSIADKLNVSEIVLKGPGGGDATITYASTTTDTTHTLPATTGTLLNTGTTTWTEMDPTAAKVGTLKLNGSNKPLYDVFLYSRGANLKSNSITDINTVKTPSVYYSASSTESTGITNTPWTSSGYRLITMAGYSGVSDYGYQLGAASSQMFWRTMGSNNGSPSDWYSWIKYKYGTAVGSNATPIYLNSSGDPLPISILSTGNGGTGNSGFTAGTLIYASSATKLSSNDSATISGSTMTLTNSSTSAASYTATNTNGAVQLLASTNRGMYDSTNSKWIVYTSKAADHTYIPLWKDKGSSTQPVYFNSNGEPVAATAYSGLLTGLSWSNRTLSLTVGGTNKTAAIPTTLTGFSSITSTDFWGALNRKYSSNTSNAIIGMSWYKSNGTTLYQYILGRNATSGTDDGETSHILINPSYDTSKTTYDTSQGLVIGKNTFTYYGSKVLTAANYASTTDGTYVNVTGDTMTGNLTMHDSDGTNPWIGFKTKDSTSYLGYIQLAGTTMYVGNGSANSLSVDNTGKTSTPQSYYTSNTGRGYYLKDSAGQAYPGVYDNGANLWLGSTATAATHHKGQTYISAGHSGTSGNTTIYVSVPNAANNNGTNYGVFHEGYLNVSKATAGSLAIARGGTGATTAAAARTNLGVPPTNHASTATTYGVGDSTKYGHVILYPAASCTSYTSDAGGACTPAAVKKAVQLFGLESFKVGDTLTTARTDLGNNWLLCNGEDIKVIDAPLLAPLFGGEKSFIIDMKSTVSTTYPKTIAQQRSRLNTLIANGKILVFDSGYGSSAVPGLTVYYKDIGATTWSYKTIDSSITGRSCVGVFYIQGYYIVCVGNAQETGRMYYSSNLTSWSYKEFTSGYGGYAALANVTYANGYWFVTWCTNDGENSSSSWADYQKIFYASSIGGTYAAVTVPSFSDEVWGQGVAYFNGRYMFVKNYYNPGYYLPSSSKAVIYGTSPDTIKTSISVDSGSEINSNEYRMGKYKIINNECIFYGDSNKICIVNSSFEIRFPSLYFNVLDIYYKNGVYTFIGVNQIARYYGTSLWTMTNSDCKKIAITSYSSNDIINVYDETNDILLRIQPEYNTYTTTSKQQAIYLYGSFVLPSITHDKVYTYIKKE